MSYLKFIIVIIVTLISCNVDIKNNRNSIKSVNTKISESKIYNDILNELIEDHFYHRFLGKERNSLLVKFYRKKIDSASFISELEKYQKGILNSTRKKSVIFLKTNVNNTDFSRYRNIIHSERINQFIENNRIDKISDSLNFINTRLKPSNFNLKLANIQILKEEFPSKFDIGYFAFSKLFINQNIDQGLLYFFVNCGPKCGESGILLIVKENTTWEIMDKEIFTES